MTEPEFVLLDEPPPAPGEAQARPLRRAGRHGVRKSVLVRVEGYPHRHRLLALVVLLAAVGAAVVVIRRRKAREPRERTELVLLEDGPDTLALREPPISAV